MHPRISRYASDAFYASRLRDGAAARDRASDAAYAWRTKIPAFAPVAFLNLRTSAENTTTTSGTTTKGAAGASSKLSSSSAARSRANRAEADLAANACAAFLAAHAAHAARRHKNARGSSSDDDNNGATPPDEENSAPSVAVISFYRDQLAEIRRALERRALSGRDIEVNTVDAFQGREKDVVVISCVRADDDGVGFLKDARRLNVAVTRAKHACLVIGREATLETDPKWRGLIRYARDAGALVDVPSEHADLLRLAARPSPGGVSSRHNGPGPPPPAARAAASAAPARGDSATAAETAGVVLRPAQPRRRRPRHHRNPPAPSSSGTDAEPEGGDDDRSGPPGPPPARRQRREGPDEEDGEVLDDLL